MCGPYADCGLSEPYLNGLTPLRALVLPGAEVVPEDREHIPNYPLVVDR